MPDRQQTFQPGGPVGRRPECCMSGCDNPPNSYYMNGALNFCALHYRAFEDHRILWMQTQQPRRVRLRRRIANLIDGTRDA